SFTVNADASLDISGLSPGLSLFGGTLAVTINGTLIAGTQVLAGNGGALAHNTFSLSQGGTLSTANVNGILNDSSCTLYNFNTVNLSPAANYVFNGAADQSTIGLPATVNSLTDNNSAGTVVLNQQTTVATNVTLAAGAKLSLPAGTISSAQMLMIDGSIQAFGTWGNTGSGATHADATHFAGTGQLNVANGPADPAHSTLTPAVASITADGSSTQVITVTTRDVNGHPLRLGGSTVVISQSSGTGTLGSTLDNGDGTYAATVTAPTVIGSATFTATMNGVAVGSAVGSDSSMVTYTAGPATAAQSTITSSPPVVPADGVSSATIAVHLVDQNGNPVPGKNVMLAQSSGRGMASISPAVSISDASGLATFTVRSTTMGADVFTATDTSDSITLAQTAQVIFLSPSGIISTANGGLWSNPATWQGGVVPVSSNDVMVATTGSGSVILDGNQAVNSLMINEGAKFSISYNGANESLAIHGDLANYGSFTRFGSTPAAASTIYFSGTPSVWTGSGDLSANKISFTVNTGSTLDISGLSTGIALFSGTVLVSVNGTLITGTQVLAGSGGASAHNTFDLVAGGTLITANLNGITNDSSCTVYNFNTVKLSTLANYIFNGAADQATIGLPAVVNSLTDNNTNGAVTLVQGITVTTNVTLAAGAVLSLPAGVTSTAKTLIVGGLLRAAGTWGNTGSGATHIDPAHFAGTGRLNVATGSTLPTTPTAISYSLSGSTLSVSWPSAYLGWILQSQTNGLNQGLSTNWVDVPGSAGVTATNLTVQPGNSAMFFRLRYP
ncbi:MAG: invasin domain 3-containing protein, partial [Verrucomicrobiota bacterium]